MMNEQAAVASTASRYRKAGYGVELNVPLPAELGASPDLVADLIAFGPDERVVVEVKRRSELQSDPSASRIAQAVAGVPGWRFELVLVPEPTADLPPIDAEAQSFSISEAASHLERSKVLWRSGFPDAAFVMGTAAGEAILRAIVDRFTPAPRWTSWPALIKGLDSIGILAPSEIESLNAAWRIRNAFAHGYRPANVSEALFAEFVEVLRRLAAAQGAGSP